MANGLRALLEGSPRSSAQNEQPAIDLHDLPEKITLDIVRSPSCDMRMINLIARSAPFLTQGPIHSVNNYTDARQMSLILR